MPELCRKDETDRAGRRGGSIEGFPGQEMVRYFNVDIGSWKEVIVSILGKSRPIPVN